MKWNAFNLTKEGINKTKSRLFPFNFSEWFKLSIIFILAGSENFFNFRISFNEIDFIRTFDIGGVIFNYWKFILVVLIFIFLISILIIYIQSVFSFIFLESVIKKKAVFNFRKNHSKGVSLFLFRFLIGLITLVFLGIILMPYFVNIFNGNPILNSIGPKYIIFSALSLFFYFFSLWFLFLFFYDFVIPYMYLKNISAFSAFKKIWKEILKNKKEVFVYWLVRFFLGIVISIISLIIILVLILIFGLGVLFIILLGVFLFLIFPASLVFLLVLGGLIGFNLFWIFFFTIIMVFIPFNVFKRYFSLLNFEKLTKLKIVKDL